MRLPLLIPTLLALAAIAGQGQVAAGIHVVRVQLDGDTRINGVDLTKCAADIRSKDYDGTNWLENVGDPLRACLQEKGYFKAMVLPSARQLPDKNGTHQFLVNLTIQSGQRYELGEITFTGNHVFSAAELRSMFKLKSGDVFSTSGIRDGLDRMRQAYLARGYANFTAVPDFTINDSERLISLAIDADESK